MSGTEIGILCLILSLLSLGCAEEWWQIAISLLFVGISILMIIAS